MSWFKLHRHGCVPDKIHETVRASMNGEQIDLMDSRSQAKINGRVVWRQGDCSVNGLNVYSCHSAKWGRSRA